MNERAQDQTSSLLAGGFQLGSLRIRPPTGEAIGPAATKSLDRKVMDVLVVLAERAGQVVPREELLALLWPNVVVTDEVLSRCIYELRRQLSLASGTEDFRQLIETLPKRGYRLIAKVTPLDSPVRATGSRTRHRLIAAGCVAVLVVAFVFGLETGLFRSGDQRLSVAVLPFEDMSETQDQAYLADGIAEEILDKLNQSTDLRVIARTSSFVFRGKNAAITEIARKLDVTHVLEGSVRRDGDDVRITAQLIATADSSHIWSTTFERKLGSLFVIQEEIALAVASALNATLRLDASVQRREPDLAAYDLAKQGEYFYDRRAPGDIERAIERLEHAVRIDPEYARAWAALAGMYSYQAWQVDPPSRALQARQGDAALRAVELDPELATAQARLAQYYKETGDAEASDRHYALALEHGRDDPLVLGYMASDAMEAEDFATAADLQERALARDPMSIVRRQLLSVALIAGNRLDEALTNYGTMLEIFPDAHPDYVIEIPRILALQGHYDRAVPAALRLPAGRYRDQAMSLMHRAPGFDDDADAALARLEAYVPSPPFDTVDVSIMDTIRLAEAYAFRGESDRAFAILTRKLDWTKISGEPENYAWYLRQEMRLSPFLKPLHTDPRWVTVMGQIA